MMDERGPGSPADLVGELRAELLARGGTLAGRMAGLSMAPMLLPGDELFLREPGRRLLPVGRVVAFRRGGRRIVHRVLGHRGGLLVERGDRAGPPGLVDPADVIAEVVAVGRGERTLRLDRGRGLLAGRGIAAAARLALLVPGGRVAPDPPPWARAWTRALAAWAWRGAAARGGEE